MTAIRMNIGRPADSEAPALGFVGFDRRVGPVVAAALAVGSALVSAAITPRGPITTTQVLVSMAAALAVGVGAGLVMGSRWSMLVTPLTFISVFELARLGVNGPTVDGIHPGSLYGLMALVLGRGVHGLLVILPMIVGARFGVELAARLGKSTMARMGPVGWLMTGIFTAGLLAFAVLVARPGTTAPIVGSDGQPLPGSVAELTTVRIGGHDQALMIRGRSIESPVLLHLAGGPGGTDLGAMRARHRAGAGLRGGHLGAARDRQVVRRPRPGGDAHP